MVTLCFSPWAWQTDFNKGNYLNVISTMEIVRINISFYYAAYFIIQVCGVMLRTKGSFANVSSVRSAHSEKNQEKK